MQSNTQQHQVWISFKAMLKADLNLLYVFPIASIPIALHELRVTNRNESACCPVHR